MRLYCHQLCSKVDIKLTKNNCLTGEVRAVWALADMQELNGVTDQECFEKAKLCINRLGSSVNRKPCHVLGKRRFDDLIPQKIRSGLCKLVKLI